MHPALVSMTIVLVVAALLWCLGLHNLAAGLVAGGVAGNLIAFVEQRYREHRRTRETLKSLGW